MAGPAHDDERRDYVNVVEASRDASASEHVRRLRTIAVLVAGLAVAAVLVGGLVPSLVLRPLPDPPPAPGLLDREGFGAVRLGQPFSECRTQGGPGGPCGGSSNSVTAVDSEHRCTRYEGPGGPGWTRGAVWVWVRDGTVVAVGVRSAPGTESPFQVWPGLRLGDALDPRPPALERFVEDGRTRVTDHRLEVDGVTTTLADTDADGSLDSASVVAPAGLACRADRPSSAA